MCRGRITLLRSVMIFCFIVFPAADQETITAHSGQDVTLTCRAPNNNFRIVEWSRADLGDTFFVLVYRDGHFYPDDQHPSFKNRVDLQDRQMKDGDVSVILKDAMINDTGTYECRVFMEGTNRRKRAHQTIDLISTIYLRVVDPPGQPGDTENGGKDRSIGLKVGLPVGLVVVAAAAAAAAFVCFLIYRRVQQDSYQPPPV